MIKSTTKAISNVLSIISNNVFNFDFVSRFYYERFILRSNKLEKVAFLVVTFFIYVMLTKLVMELLVSDIAVSSMISGKCMVLLMFFSKLFGASPNSELIQSIVAYLPTDHFIIVIMDVAWELGLLGFLLKGLMLYMWTVQAMVVINYRSPTKLINYIRRAQEQ